MAWLSDGTRCIQYNARAKPLFCVLTVLFGDVLGHWLLTNIRGPIGTVVRGVTAVVVILIRDAKYSIIYKDI